MLALSKKNLLFFIVLVALLAVVATLAVIHATNPALWHQILTNGPVPHIVNNFF